MFKSCSLKLNIQLANILLKYFSKFQRSSRGNQRQRPPWLRQADAADHREGVQVDQRGGRGGTNNLLLNSQVRLKRL